MTDYSNMVRIILKLLGVGLVVYSAVTLSTYIPAIVDSSTPVTWSLVLAHAAPTIITCLFGIFLWLFPAKVADTIVLPNVDIKNVDGEWDAKVERIGVTILGIFLLYRALSDVAFNVTGYVTNAPTIRNQVDFQASLAATTLEFILALFLVLGASGITNTLRKLRATN